MAEYIGYKSNRDNQVDWNGALSGLSANIQYVDKSRQERRAENEKILKDSEALINDTEQPKSKTLNEFVLKGADNGRSSLYRWNQQLKEGKITAADYKTRVANLNEYWSSLAGATKSLDTRITQAMERQQPGPDGTLPPASAIEAELQGYFGGLSQLSDKDIVIDDDGKVKIGKFSPDGKLLSSEDVKYINNPGNITFNRTDLSGMVAEDVKNWGEWSIGRVSDVRQNPQFAKAKNRLTETLVGSPRSAASILVDNTDGDYDVYFNEEDKQSKINKIKQMNAEIGVKESESDIAKRLIRMQQDPNGDYQPNLTHGQLEEAKKLVGTEIELQLGRNVAPAPMYGGGYGRGSGKDDEPKNNLYEDLRTAWDLSREDNMESENRLSSLTGGKYEFKWVKGGLQPYQVDTDRRGDKKVIPVGGPVNTLDAIQKFFYGSRSEYDQEKEEYNGRKKPVSKYTPNAASQAEFEQKWAKLKSGETIVGPDGQTYRKK